MTALPLYDRLGGTATLQKIVQKMYIGILTDPILCPFFDPNRIDVLKRSQAAFLTVALGGPHAYEGRDLRTAHAPLVARGLNDKHFDAVKYHLRKAMQGLSIDAALIAESLEIVETTRTDVLCR